MAEMSAPSEPQTASRYAIQLFSVKMIALGSLMLSVAITLALTPALGMPTSLPLLLFAAIVTNITGGLFLFAVGCIKLAKS